MGRLEFIIIALIFFSSFFLPLTSSQKHGAVFLVGGGEFPGEVIPWIYEHSHEGPLLIISAHSINLENWTEIVQDHPFEYILLGTETNEEENIRKVMGASAIIFDGGDQHDYVELLMNTELSLIIQKRFDVGIPIGGNSAGAYIMSEFFYGAGDGGVSSDEAQDKAASLDIQREFFKIPQLRNFIVDTHYTERNREGRLKVFVKEIERRYNTKVGGIGIDEDTALCIDREGHWFIFGKGKVHKV